MKNPLCYLGLHFWTVTKEKHDVTGHPKGFNSVRVLVRECKFCGHREHHLLPRENKKLDKWVNFDHVGKDSLVDYKEL